MVDRIAKVSFFTNFATSFGVKVASNVGNLSTITDFDIKWSMTLTHLIATTGAPGQDAPTLQYAWQAVATGAANTNLNGSNLNSGPWMYAGQLNAAYYSPSGVPVGSSNVYYQWPAGGHSHVYFPQVPAGPFDVWLTLYTDWVTIYGFDPSIEGDAVIWYYGP